MQAFLHQCRGRLVAGSYLLGSSRPFIYRDQAGKYPGLSFSVPSDPVEYERRLAEIFPTEKLAIRRYFMPGAVGLWIGLLNRITSRKAIQTTQDYLDRNFIDPRLKTLLTSQWGDYGLPPLKSAFAIHAMIVEHYLHGAWFPEGGAGRIARTFETGIETRGGCVKFCQEAISILVENSRVTGVRVIDRRGSEAVEKTYRAPLVISNVGAQLTYERLLPVEGEIGRKTARYRESIQRLKGGGSAVTLYLRLRGPVSTLGIRGENYWINTVADHGSIMEMGRKALQGKPEHIYVSFPSSKSGEQEFHTAEIISFVDDEAFSEWQSRPHGNRGAAYSALKEKISDGLLDLAETVIPGLKKMVQYRELSTPLSVEHFTSRTLC